MFDTQNFFWFVTFLALAYSIVIRLIQMKMLDPEKTKGLQKRMNELNKEYLSALKSNNKKRMDSIQEEQNKIMPEFNKLMVGQLKMMGVVIVVFLIFMYPVNSFDPFVNDDVHFNLTPLSSEQGKWCGTFPISCESAGPWSAEATAYSGTSEKAVVPVFFYCLEEGGTLPSPVSRNANTCNMTTDKKVYSHNDNVTVCLTTTENIDRAAGKADSGTWFMVPLPFTIPVLEANAINGANIWFIVISIIFGLIFSFVWGKLKKKKGETK